MRRSVEETINAVITDLEYFRSRPTMFVGGDNVTAENATAFLNGIDVGLLASGIKFAENAWFDVQTARGWVPSPLGPVPQMVQRGMNVSEIINELVEIYIQTLRRHTGDPG
jgi:hypothetical protein